MANTEETTGGECATDKLAITVSYIDVHFKSCTRCKTLYATHPYRRLQEVPYQSSVAKTQDNMVSEIIISFLNQILGSSYILRLTISFYLLVYINMGSGSSDTATLDFSFTGVNSARAWEVKVTQLPCNHPNRY